MIINSLNNFRFITELVLANMVTIELGLRLMSQYGGKKLEGQAVNAQTGATVCHCLSKPAYINRTLLIYSLE